MSVITDWFPADTKPVHVGVYQIRKNGNNNLRYWRYWDGKFWRTGKLIDDPSPSDEDAKVVTLAFNQNVEWCRVLELPE